MSVELTGQLICADAHELRTVEEHLPLHRNLTRSEPGCIDFDVVQTSDPFVWQVDEVFVDEAAFAAHQDRAARSEWGRVTAGIERRYNVSTRKATGLADGERP
ncbi:MAG TPA: antibiotic biosynthesis monooxygenase [Candidatus Stackebrandtia excrementipullorum]|nr:antibiotic biosynthesis monooxygenase [Candidatus Stackebrandtia excrementipullorum]